MHIHTYSLSAQIIDQLVFSHPSYCVQAYSNALNCHLQQIQKVFTFVSRLISDWRRFERISNITRTRGWLSARNFSDLTLARTQWGGGGEAF